MECPPTRAEAWLGEHEPDLVGLAPDDAAVLVEGAGLRVRVLAASSAGLSAELHDDRVNLWLTPEHAVGGVSAG